MSYDLYFTYTAGENRVLKEDFQLYFASRRNYDIQGDNAVYQNESTGVNFCFSFDAPSTFDTDDGEIYSLVNKTGIIWADLSFKINYYRPSIFALEACYELSALVNNYQLSIYDAQAAGNEHNQLGPFNEKQFMEGWRLGNQFSIDAKSHTHKKRGELPIHDALPSDMLIKDWQWNYNRYSLQEQLGDRVYVPQILYLASGDDIWSMVAWSDAIPIALPTVDRLIVQSKKLKGNRLLKMFRRFRGLHGIINYNDALPCLMKSGTPRTSDGGQYLLIDFRPPTPTLVDLFQSAPSTSHSHEIVPVDMIIDKELINDSSSSIARA